MTTVATFPAPEDAHLFRAFLEAQGIEGFVLDEYFVQLFWYYSNTLGGVRVVVDDGDEEDAMAVYQEYMLALREGPYPLHPVRGWPIVLLVSLLAGIPLMIFGRKREPDPMEPLKCDPRFRGLAGFVVAAISAALSNFVILTRFYIARNSDGDFSGGMALSLNLTLVVATGAGMALALFALLITGFSVLEGTGGRPRIRMFHIFSLLLVIPAGYLLVRTFMR